MRALAAMLLPVAFATGVLADAEPGMVRVFYPRGDCSTGIIEVEIFDRASERWKPHPAHPRVPAGSCQSEDPGVLLHEIRIRCVDPEGTVGPSAWRVGFDVYKPRAAPDCDQEG